MFLLWLVCVVPCGPLGVIECRVDRICLVAGWHKTCYSFIRFSFVYIYTVFKALFRYFYCNLVAV